ncbi:MAG TPA: hypothetical protein VL769_08515 [Acidimicrobiia bacterium]|nr:hypothetical protein [Acidimicrobiia bacterium]
MRRRVTRAVVLAPAISIIVLTGIGSVFADTTTTTTPVPETKHPGVNRVLVISLPTISWEDLDLARLPNLERLFSRSAVADLIVRGVVRLPTLADGYLTIGAGTRSVGVSRTDSPCLELTEPFGQASARDELVRRGGVAAATIPQSAIGCLAERQIAAKNARMLFDAKTALLGDTLEAAGVERAVIGNGDMTLTPSATPAGGVAGDTDFRRFPPLALADHDGIVPAGAVGSSLLERDPSAPFGLRLDPDRVLAAFNRAWDGGGSTRSVVLVEASDLLRLRAYEPVLTSSARSAMQQRVLAGVDAMVGRLLQRVDPAHDAVLVVAPSQRRGPGRLTVVALRAPGIRPGLAESNWTRHSGLVHIVDIGPTILDQLGFKPPAAMEGRPMYYDRSGGSFADRVAWMVDTNAAAQFRDREIAPVTVAFVLLQIALTLAALIAFVRLGRRALITIELAALALIGFLAAMFLAGFFAFYDIGVGSYWLFLFGVGAAIALIGWFTTERSGVMTLIVPLGILVGLILVDVATGARLQFNTVFGYTPTVSGRYAGLGNLAYAAFAAGALLLAGLLADRIGGRRGALVAIALLGAAIVVDGAPFFGSDVGGVLSMVPAYALTATLLLGWRLRLRLVALYGAATLVLLALFAAIDLSRPVDKRTHLGRLVASGEGEGGPHAVWSMIRRKLEQSNAVYSSSIWSIMFPLVLAGIAYLIYRAPGRMRGLHQRLPQFSASLTGLGVLIVLGTLLNDSGIAIAGVMLGVVTPVLIVITVRGDRVLPARVARAARAAPVDLPGSLPERVPE